MSITPWGKRLTVRLCRSAALLVLAFALSLLEHLLPLSLILPLPGVKLGLANVVITVLFFYGSPLDAGIVSGTRILLSALLFGSPISLLFSALGGLFSYLVLWGCRPFQKRFFSFVGISVLSATGHHIGQICAAWILFDSGVFLTYLPVLLLAGLITGGATGALLNLSAPQLQKIFKIGCNK